MYNAFYIGDKVVLDLKNDTVRPETLAKGITAFDADGHLIVGTAIFIGDTVDIFMELTQRTYVFSYGLRWYDFCAEYGDEGWDSGIADDGTDVIVFNGTPLVCYDENGKELGYVRATDLVKPNYTYYA